MEAAAGRDEGRGEPDKQARQNAHRLAVNERASPKTSHPRDGACVQFDDCCDKSSTEYGQGIQRHPQTGTASSGSLMARSTAVAPLAGRRRR